MESKQVIPVVAEALRNHVRHNLHIFISNVKNFSNEAERKEAEETYKKMMTKEKELKTTTKSQFKMPPNSPTEHDKFDVNIFKERTKENVLKKALVQHFKTCSAAAWDYFTLTESCEKLADITRDSAKGSAVPPKKEKEGDRRKDRFETTNGANKAKDNHKASPDNENGYRPEEGATSQAASVVKDVEMADHAAQSHLRHDHAENPTEEVDPDYSKRLIPNLLWMHQDFFDQKVLSRAQAEYNYYTVLEKEWEKTVNRVEMKEDIAYPKFSLQMFKNLSKTRPLHAVILTILEQSKDKKHAEAAAEEYLKLTVLEQKMIEQKMITAIPQGIDLDGTQYNDLYRDMGTRFKSSGSQVQMRQAGEFKMIPLFEYFKLKETITLQRKQIEELASRLSGIASQQLAEGEAGFTDLGDKNRPQKLGERFAELFDETWSSAYESLKPKKEGEDEESDEKTMDLLQSVVKVIYDFCLKVSQEQIERIVGGMIPPIVNPMQSAESQEILKPTDAMRAKTEHMAKEYRKVVAPATIKVLQQEIYEKELKGKWLIEPVGKEVEKYVQQCVDLIWYMCIQQPAMEIVWATPGEKFDREQFRFSGKKGKKYKLTVWPAVYLHKGGPLVAPGYAIPE